MLGQNDFIEYWSAFQLFINNADIYNPSLMATVQQAEGFIAQPPLMMWLPPWALLLFYPLLCWSFQTSSTLWLIANIALLFGSAALINQIYCLKPKQRPYLFVAAFCFLPTLSTIHLGQVSLFLLFGLLVSIWLIKQEQDFLAGIPLVVLSLKPHLFLIYAVALLYWLIKNRRYKIVFGVLVGLLLCVLTVELLSSNALSFWIDSLISTQPGAPAKLSWVTPTLTGMARLLFAHDSAIPLWPLVLIPGLALIVVLFLSIRAKLSVDIIIDTPLLLAISFCFSAFGWIFDAVLLLPAILLFLSQNFERYPNKKIALLFVFISLQLAAMFVHSNYVTAHHTLVWFPCLLLLLELYRRRDKHKAI